MFPSIHPHYRNTFAVDLDLANMDGTADSVSRHRLYTEICSHKAMFLGQSITNGAHMLVNPAIHGCKLFMGRCNTYPILLVP